MKSSKPARVFIPDSLCEKRDSCAYEPNVSCPGNVKLLEAATPESDRALQALSFHRFVPAHGASFATAFVGE